MDVHNRNVEIKAKIEDLEELRNIVHEISDTRATIIYQEDIFFKSNNGRLKLRTNWINMNSESELIQYEREDVEGPKLSNFVRCSISDRGTLKEALDKALGTLGSVKKIRTLYKVGNTRIHLDEVVGLGNFIELEVMMSPYDAVEKGQEIAQDLMQQLHIKEENLLSCAYIDLLLQKSNK